MEEMFLRKHVHRPGRILRQASAKAGRSLWPLLQDRPPWSSTDVFVCFRTKRKKKADDPSRRVCLFFRPFSRVLSVESKNCNRNDPLFFFIFFTHRPREWEQVFGGTILPGVQFITIGVITRPTAYYYVCLATPLCTHLVEFPRKQQIAPHSTPPPPGPFVRALRTMAPQTCGGCRHRTLDVFSALRVWMYFFHIFFRWGPVTRRERSLWAAREFPNSW